MIEIFLIILSPIINSLNFLFPFVTFVSEISNILNELNDLRFNYYKVSQINENHVLNYFLSEVKASIKI